MMPSSRTLWSVVAAAQAALWFFALPPLCKPHWERVWALSPGPLVSQVILNQLAIIYFIGYTLVMLPIYHGNYRFFEQYKISDKPWAWRSDKQEERDAFWALSARSVKLFCFNFGVLVPVLTVGKFFVLGDNMSFGIADWPSYPTLLRDNLALTLVHEFGFYWCHRLAHHPKLYRFHKVHHEYKQNTVLASQHEHPIDYVVTIATPALLAVCAVAPHSFTLFQWIAWLIMANNDDHAGYAFPWSPVRWFPFAAATDQHEFHHSKNMGCFASKLGIYDKMFNSEEPYCKWRAARDAKASLKVE
jgi:sterol desaturase/sphingolipid hydroxylase (fatty acid hydroxylase superfamily)